MAISTETRRSDRYACDGVQTAFPFAFKVFKADEIGVIVSPDGETETTLSSELYTVSLNEDQDNNPGGVVNLLTAPADGTILVVVSNVAYKQQIVFTNQGGFYPELLNEGYDRLTILTQQLKEHLDRTITVPPTSPTSPQELFYKLLNAAKEALESAQSAEEALAACEQIRQLIQLYSWDIPHIVDSLRDVENYPYDGLFAVAGFGNAGGNGQNISNRYVKAEGSTELRTLGERFADVVNVRDYGAKGDGTTDDTAAISAAFENADQRTVYFPAGTYAATSVNMSAGCSMDSGATLLFVGEDNTSTFVVCSTDSTRHGRIAVNANNKQVSNLVQINGNKNYFGSIYLENLASSTILTCGVVVYGNENVVEETIIRNFVNSGYWNDSSPQGLVLSSNATKNTFNSVSGYYSRSTVVDDSTGTNYFGSVSSFDCQDNGFYGVAEGTSVINSLQYSGTNNAAGFRHSHTSIIGSIFATGSCGVFFGDCGNVQIGEIIANGVKTIITTNEADAGDISIGRIDARLTDGYPIFFASENGSVASLSINELNADVTITGTSESFSRNSFIRLDGCQGVRLGSVRINIHYQGNSENQHLYIRFNPALTKSSFLGRCRIRCLTADGSTANSAVFAQNCWQENLTVLSGVVQGGYLTLSSASSLTDDSLTSPSAPTDGYWKQGKVLWKTSNNGTVTAYVCTESGTPGTWAAIPVTNTDGTFNALTATRVYPTQHLYPREDNVVSAGLSSNRFSTVFAATGTINTSDQRVKTSVASASDTLLDAWGEVPVHTFVFTDAVEKKGADAARLHVGVVAQEVQQAFALKGLDATRYGLFCHDAWEDEYETVEVVDQPEVFDENGEVVSPAITHTEQKLITAAGDRFGIRYEEALCLEAAYQRRRADRLEERLAALEKRMTIVEAQ